MTENLYIHNGTTGWEKPRGASTLTESGGVITTTSQSGATFGAAYVLNDLIVGDVYQVDFEFTREAPANGTMSVRISPQLILGTEVNPAVYTAGEEGGRTYQAFEATATTMYVGGVSFSHTSGDSFDVKIHSIVKYEADKRFISCGDKTSDMVDLVNRQALSTPCAAGQLLFKLANEFEDCSVFVNGDSTGDEENEWVYLLSQWYAEKFPQYSVYYQDWNGANYAETRITIGLGSYRLDVYNSSISGTVPEAVMGDDWEPAVVDINQCDLIIINHGHNIQGYGASEDVNLRMTGIYLSAVASMVRVHYSAGVIFIAQNPVSNTDQRVKITKACITSAGLLGADVADVTTRFYEQGRDASLYVDSTHPSEAGSQVFLDAVTNVHASLVPRACFSPLDDRVDNLLTNGSFSSFSVAVPDNWSQNNATIAKETVAIDGRNTYTVHVAPTVVGSASFLQQYIGSAVRRSLAGGWVTLSARVRIPSAHTADSVGGIALETSSQSSNVSVGEAFGRDGFMWRSVSVRYLSSDTYLLVKLFGDSGTTNGEAFFDRAVLTRGKLPRDIY